MVNSQTHTSYFLMLQSHVKFTSNDPLGELFLLIHNGQVSKEATKLFELLPFAYSQSSSQQGVLNIIFF